MGRESETAFAYILQADLASKIVKPPKQILVNLLQTLGCTYLKIFNFLTTKKLFSSFFADFINILHASIIPFYRYFS